MGNHAHPFQGHVMSSLPPDEPPDDTPSDEDVEIVADVPNVFAADMETPTDEPKIAVPKRGRRQRLLGEGEGDVCIYVVCDGNNGIPLGALLPVEGVPRFESVQQAKRWITTQSGDILVGMQIMIFTAKELINVVAQRVTKVALHTKMKIRKGGRQETLDAED